MHLCSWGIHIAILIQYITCRDNLQLLRQRYYYATWKADGTRYMMLITMDGCYLIDRHFNFRRVQMRFPCKQSHEVWINSARLEDFTWFIRNVGCKINFVWFSTSHLYICSPGFSWEDLPSLHITWWGNDNWYRTWHTEAGKKISDIWHDGTQLHVCHGGSVFTLGQRTFSSLSVIIPLFVHFRFEFNSASYAFWKVL